MVYARTRSTRRDGRSPGLQIITRPPPSRSLAAQWRYWRTPSLLTVAGTAPDLKALKPSHRCSLFTRSRGTVTVIVRGAACSRQAGPGSTGNRDMSGPLRTPIAFARVRR